MLCASPCTRTANIQHVRQPLDLNRALPRLGQAGTLWERAIKLHIHGPRSVHNGRIDANHVARYYAVMRVSIEAFWSI